MASNIWKLNAIRLLFWMHFFGAVLVPFYREWGGLDLQQILMLNSWFMLCNFLAEVPTGTVADFLGRKASLVVGSLVALIAAVVYVSGRSLASFMIAEAIFAVAYTLHSGADEAIAYDSLLAVGGETRSKRVLARMESFKLGGIVIAAMIGGWIAKRWGISAPMLAYVIPAGAAALLALTLTEPPVAKIVAGARRLSYGTILREGGRFFLGNKVLLILTVEAALVNAAAWGIIWLFQPLLEAAGMSLAIYGWVQAGACIAQIAVLSNIERIEHRLGTKRRLLIWGSVGAGAAFIGLAFATALPVVVALIVVAFALGLTRIPIFSSYMNKLIPSEQRATILSLSSMARTLAIVIVNPLIGMAADRSLSYTVLGLGIALVVLPALSRIEEWHLAD